MRDLFELGKIKFLISATVRNEQTLDAFIIACGEWRGFIYSVYDLSSDQAAEKNSFTVEQLNISMPKRENQMGFFFPTTTAIKIFLVTNEGPVQDPFAV